LEYFSARQALWQALQKSPTSRSDGIASSLQLTFAFDLDFPVRLHLGI